MKKIILFGMGGHALSCVDVMLGQDFKIIGYIDKKEKKNYYDIPFLGPDQDIENIKRKYKVIYGLISFGSHKLINARTKLFTKLISLKFMFIPVIAKTAYISKMSNIDVGTIIMQNATINTGVHVGNNCIINTNSVVDHNSKIGNNSIISTNVTINGNVKIGKNSFIGSGAIIFNDIIIGDNCIIGAGQVIKKNLKNNSIVK